MGENIYFELNGVMFEYYSEKSDWTLKKRGFDFDFAAHVFFDDYALTDVDRIDEDGEQRYNILGSAKGTVLVVAYCIRESHQKRQ